VKFKEVLPNTKVILYYGYSGTGMNCSITTFYLNGNPVLEIVLKLGMKKLK